jgi:hypothetical protein
MPSGRMHRRCHECGVVRVASAFRRSGRESGIGPDRAVRCPDRGHVGPRWSFPKAGPPTEGGEG